MTRYCNANANEYELIDSSPDSLGYQPEELTNSSPDSLGYRPEKRTPDIMTDVVRAVRATRPKEKKAHLSSPDEASKWLESCKKEGAKSRECAKEEGRHLFLPSKKAKKEKQASKGASFPTEKGSKARKGASFPTEKESKARKGHLSMLRREAKQANRRNSEEATRKAHPRLRK